jgi:death on curing protein
MKWIRIETVLAIHDEQLAEHGGWSGVNLDLLESALHRPKDKAHYEGNPPLAELAAAYAFGIVKNHPFVDGNKRTGLAVAESFLNLNGVELTATDEAVVHTFESLAAGQLADPELAEWFKQSTQIGWAGACA